MLPVCEIWRSDDVEGIYRLRDALALRGLEAQVLGAGGRGLRGLPSWSELRLMVQERDLVYARWILSAAGVDCWPEPRDERDEQKVMADVLA